MAPKVRGSPSKSKGKRKQKEAPLFETNEAMERFTGFSNRTIIHGKVFDPVLFSSHGLRIRRLFARQGITPFLSICRTSYNRLIRLFYSNLSWKDDSQDTLCTYLHGTNFSFSVENLAEVFELPQENVVTIPDKTLLTGLPTFHLPTAINLVRKEPVENPTTRFDIAELSLQSRLIHSIINYCILPRSGSRSYVSTMDIFLIWAITTGFRIDFADLIFHHMFEVSDRNRAALPYGMALSALFDSFGLDVSIETDTYEPSPHDRYTESTLHLMHYKVHRNRWVLSERVPRVRQPVEQAADDEEEIEEPVFVDQPSQPSNQQLYELMNSGFHQMNLSFQQIQSQFDTTNTHIHGIEDYLRSKDADSNFPPW